MHEGSRSPRALTFVASSSLRLGQRRSHRRPASYGVGFASASHDLRHHRSPRWPEPRCSSSSQGLTGRRTERLVDFVHGLEHMCQPFRDRRPEVTLAHVRKLPASSARKKLGGDQVPLRASPPWTTGGTPKRGTYSGRGPRTFAAHSGRGPRLVEVALHRPGDGRRAEDDHLGLAMGRDALHSSRGSPRTYDAMTSPATSVWPRPAAARSARRRSPAFRRDRSPAAVPRRPSRLGPPGYAAARAMRPATALESLAAWITAMPAWAEFRIVSSFARLELLRGAGGSPSGSPRHAASRSSWSSIAVREASSRIVRGLCGLPSFHLDLRQVDAAVRAVGRRLARGAPRARRSRSAAGRSPRAKARTRQRPAWPWRGPRCPEPPRRAARLVGSRYTFSRW